MTERDWDIWAAMAKVAGRRETIPYGSLAASVGISTAELTPRLDPIAAYETRKRRPILSAVVVSGTNNMPSKGFFDYAERIHAFSGRDREAFWKEELERVHRYWKP